MADARAMLESMIGEAPGLGSLHYELGLLLAEANQSEAAIASLEKLEDGSNGLLSAVLETA